MNVVKAIMNEMDYGLKEMNEMDYVLMEKNDNMKKTEVMEVE